jgi:lipopolysaccharide transport system ATP-binding protein
MLSEIALRVDGLSKCFHIYRKPRDRFLQLFFCGRKRFYWEHWAIRQASFQLKKGETLGIIGRNGSGKSTLLQMVSGTLAPTAGEVFVNGSIAALLELGSGFNPEFTGRENIHINALLHGVSRREIESIFAEIEEFADIGEYIDLPIKFYSSGMAVRLAFAVSVCFRPDILVIDEALAVGDAAFQFKCLDRLNALATKGTSILLVSHDTNLIKNFCDRVVYVRKGEPPIVGRTDEMVELFLLEMRNQQRLTPNNQVPVTRKPHISSVGGLAYGTNEGQIVSAAFVGQHERHPSYRFGDAIAIGAQVVYVRSVSHPSISFTIQDSKLIVVGGGNFPLRSEIPDADFLSAAITVRFTPKLSAGRYYVTLKLFDGYDEAVAKLLEKQVAILEFEIIQTEKKFLGAFDLGFEQVFENHAFHDAVINEMGEQ